jgi:hypothetical protein
MAAKHNQIAGRTVSGVCRKTIIRCTFPNGICNFYSGIEVEISNIFKSVSVDCFCSRIQQFDGIFNKTLKQEQ